MHLPPCNTAESCDRAQAAVSQNNVEFLLRGHKRSREEVKKELNNWMRGQSLLCINNKEMLSAVNGNN